MTFALMISEAVRAANPNADDAHVARVVAGVSADPAWRDLTWLTRELASGVLETQLKARAVAISNALKNVEAAEPATAEREPADIAARFDLTPEEWKRTPPAKRLELIAAAEEKAKGDAAEATQLAALRARAAEGKLSPAEKLHLARLDTPTAATKAQRRDPAWKRAQEESASLETLRKIKHGHDLEAASGAYPPTYREMHRQHSARIGKIIEEREAAGEA